MPLLPKEYIEKYEQTKKFSKFRGLQNDLVELTGMRQSHVSAALKGRHYLNDRRYSIVKNKLDSIKLPIQNEKIELLEEIENLKKSETFYCARYENSGLKKCDKMCITCDENINK